MGEDFGYKEDDVVSRERLKQDTTDIQTSTAQPTTTAPRTHYQTSFLFPIITTSPAFKMQFTTIAAAAILATTGLAAPDYADHGVEMAYFTFQGAADAQFPLEVAVDNTFKEICK